MTDGETRSSLSLLHHAARPIIPPEIVESIIEQISDDKTALMKCGLVCKSWVPACRYRLFSRLVPDPENWNFLHNSDIPNVYARAVQLA